MNKQFCRFFNCILVDETVIHTTTKPKSYTGSLLFTSSTNIEVLEHTLKNVVL